MAASCTYNHDRNRMAQRDTVKLHTELQVCQLLLKGWDINCSNLFRCSLMVQLLCWYIHVQLPQALHFQAKSAQPAAAFLLKVQEQSRTFPCGYIDSTPRITLWMTQRIPIATDPAQENGILSRAKPAEYELHMSVIWASCCLAIPWMPSSAANPYI